MIHEGMQDVILCWCESDISFMCNFITLLSVLNIADEWLALLLHI
jgi:hypothetical protein